MARRRLRDEEPILIEDVAAGAAVYTPPRGRARIVALLQNLVDFLAGPGDLDPLIRMAVAHYQFEAIHPFVDGNGRTGRILNILALVQAGLLEIPVLYLSRYIIRNKQEYYRRLRGRDRERGLGGLAAVHAGRGGGDRALDDRAHPGDPRAVRGDDGALPARSCPAGSTRRSWWS